MKDFSTGKYTDAEARQALLFFAGSRHEKFELELLNSQNQHRAWLDILPGGQVAMNSDAEVKRTATFILTENPAIPIDWSADRLRPWFCVQMPDGGWAEWPLGVFLPATPRIEPKLFEDGQPPTITVQAYDLTCILQENKTRERYTILQGTPYVEAVHDLIAQAGVRDIDIEASDLRLPADREFDAGTPRIKIVNTLLGEINYTTLECDENGVMRSQKYLSAARRSIDHEYKPGIHSVLAPDISIEKDSFNKPNVFILVVSNPDTGAMRVEKENNSMSSSISIPRRGGREVVHYEMVDNIATLAELEGYADRIMEEAAQVFEQVNYPTAIMPLHGVEDIISFSYDENDAEKYIEKAWSIPLTPGNDMTHTIVKVVQL